MKCSTQITLHSISRFLTVLIMIVGLLFLTGSNFLIYSPQHEELLCQQDAQEAPTPVEEKSKSSSGSTNILEEFLHEKHSFRELSRLNELLRHRIMDAEKLEIVHYELVSPPPKA